MDILWKTGLQSFLEQNSVFQEHLKRALAYYHELIDSVYPVVATEDIAEDYSNF